MICKHDRFTLPLPLQFVNNEAPAPRPFKRYKAPQVLAHPLLNWEPYHGDEEVWVARWHQDGALLTAKVEPIAPDASVPHLWRHRVSVKAYIEDEVVADVMLDDVPAPLEDLDMSAIMDDIVYQCGEACIEATFGTRQQSFFH